MYMDSNQASKFHAIVDGVFSDDDFESTVRLPQTYTSYLIDCHCSVLLFKFDKF